MILNSLLTTWKKTLTRTELISFLLAIATIVFLTTSASAANTTVATINTSRVLINTIFVFFCSVFVIAMNAGFGMLEAGFCRQKNAVNILFKNLITFAIATISFWAIGFAIAFGDGNQAIGMQGFFLQGLDNSPAIGAEYRGVYQSLSAAGIPLNLKFLFHAGFAATAATIVSGAVAERIKPIAYLCFSFLLVGLIYPIVAHWVWAGGYLTNLGFYDFAGGTVVHCVGGWSALSGSLILGERIEKYRNNKPTALPGHNLGQATLGCFILLVCWFAFNCGSSMSASSLDIGTIALNTLLSASAAAISATIASYAILQAADLTFVINGLLAGLVAITAGANCVNPLCALAIGSVAGALVILSILSLDRLKIDDPVGAISVHLVSGIWGTIAIGLFANPAIYSVRQIEHFGIFFGGDKSGLFIQLLGIVTVGCFSLLSSIVIWKSLGFLLGSIRVSQNDEIKGLNLTQHAGMECYPVENIPPIVRDCKPFNAKKKKPSTDLIFSAKK